MATVLDALCRSCEAPFRGGARFCVSCGAPAGPAPKRPRPALGPLQILRGATTVLGLVLVAAGLIRMLSGDQPPPAPGDPLSAQVVTMPAQTAAPTPPAISTPSPAASDPAPPTEIAPTQTPEPIQDPEPTQTPAGAAPAVQMCINHQLGFSVEYPAGWFEAGTELDGPCQLFNPEPIEITEYSEAPSAVFVFAWPDPLDVWVEQFDYDDIVIVHEREALMIAGRRAERVLYTYTEGGVDPEASGYQISVEFDGGTLVLSIYEPFTADLDATREVVDAMAASLEFSP